MGKATVTQNLGEGRYKIQIDKDMSGIDDRIEKMQTAINTLTNTDIPAAQETYDTAVSDQASEKAAFDTLVSELRALMSAGDTAGVEAKRKEVQAQTAVLIRADSTIRIAAEKLSMLNLQKLAGQKEIDRWTGIKTSAEADIRDAWAVDYTTDIEVGTEVGIVEINGETIDKDGREYIKIAPAGDDTAGTIKHGSALTGEEFFVAKAFKPGWQRWRPTYRVGTITEIDHDNNTCSVTLDDEVSEETKSSAKTNPLTGATQAAEYFEINSETNLANVPIEYMECNSDVFAEDDRVVIKFTDQDWTKPVVIGFEDEPVGCGVTIQLRLSSSEANAAFIDFMDERIADCDRFLNHLTYFEDIFLPAYYTHVRKLTWAWRGFAFGFPVFWEAEEIEKTFVEPWENWVSDYAPHLRSAYIRSRDRYVAVKAAAHRMGDNFFGTITGTADSEDAQEDVPFKDFVVTIGCCKTSATEPEAINVGGMSQYIVDREKDRFGNTLIADLKDQCSPYTEVDVYVEITNGNYYRMSGGIGGAYNTETGLVHIITVDLDGEIDGLEEGWVDGLKWVFELDVNSEKCERILSYPSEQSNAVATIPMPDRGQEIIKTLGFSMEGQFFETPESFGAEVGAWVRNEHNRIIGGEPVVMEEGITFYQLIANFSKGIFYNFTYIVGPEDFLGAPMMQSQ